ncbi:HGGxSTG domain-containing protein [Sinorhizobium meliloti]|uniref:HGGxSTG domain-containing protein n=1 Tax=Rhizobium meliloti TaxID=382 RepID=UPI00398D09F8
MNAEDTTPRHPNGQFGGNWPGKRCLAKTRAGDPCQKPALKGKSRCQLHGGRAGAPKGERNGNYKSGYYTEEAIQGRRKVRARINELIILGKQTGMFN